jgi:hypothetical protein
MYVVCMVYCDYHVCCNYYNRQQSTVCVCGVLQLKNFTLEGKQPQFYTGTLVWQELDVRINYLIT